MTAPDYADRIAAQLVEENVYGGYANTEDITVLLAIAARKGYALGLGVNS